MGYEAIIGVPVFPTPVGMNRSVPPTAAASFSVPHTRGDEPRIEVVESEIDKCSPHPWG